MAENDELKVVPVEEVKELTEGLKKDVAELKTQMAADKEATGLEIEKRGDDMQKALDAVDDITGRMDDLAKNIRTNEFAATFGDTSSELKDSLQSFTAGFGEFSGDMKANEVAAGSKPSVKHLIEGVFMKSYDDPDDDSSAFHAPRHLHIRRLQKAADDLMVVDSMMRSQMDANSLQQYNQRGGIKSLKTYKRFLAMAQDFEKAAGDLIDRTTEVANWIPTQYSANLYEQIKLGLPLVNLFPEFSMMAPTVVLPLDMNDNEAMRATEITSITNANPYADTNTVNPSAISSSKITLTAEKLRSRYWISAEAEEDAIVAMLPFLNRKHQRNMGEALEDAILNGQVTANLDTGGTHFSKANPVVDPDARYCWDGLRYWASVYTGSPATEVDNSNAKATAVAMRGLRAAMGEYGANPSALAYIFGTYGMVKLLDDANIMTIDKFGPQATIRTGSLAQVDGVDVLVSRRMAENANASGVIDGTTTDRTMAIAVHTEGAILGNRRRITLAQQKHIGTDTIELVAFWRGDFQPIYPATTVPFVATLYNIPAA